ncbi:MAG: IS66 family insertion sequence element accessory protein TnpB [Myxococcota bacterium]
MIFPSNRLRVFVATRPVDFRKGHDGLAAVVRNELRKDPFTGAVFVFRAKRADRAKIIYWDGSGLVMIYKRLEEHRFAPSRRMQAFACRATGPPVRDGVMKLSHAQFEALFAGLDWRKVYAAEARPPQVAE